MQFVLIKLDAASGFDLDRLAVLGPAAEVRRRLKSLETRSLKFSVPDSPVVEVGVVIADDDAAAFRVLERVCSEAGWTAFDRATGRFPDLRRTDAAPRKKSAAPMFYWWTGLPAWIRVVIGLIVAFMLFDIYMRAWVLSWH
jgi:hypothetical protein